MFCTKCGAQFADGSAFCPTCGNPVNAAPQQPVQPQYQQPAYQQPVYQQPAPQVAPAGAMDLQKIWHMVIAGFAALALIVGFLSLFSILEMPVTIEVGSYKMMDAEYGEVSDIAKIYDNADKSFFLGYLANIIMGLTCLAAAAVGILYFLKQQMNMPYYDQFIGKNLKGLTPGMIAGAAAAAGCVLQFILLLLAGFSEDGASMSVGAPWITWVVLVLGAGLAAVDYFVVNKKN